MMRNVIAWASAALLMSTLLVAASTTTAAAYRPWGETSAHDQFLKPGCATYRYRYRVDPPSNEWAAEIFLKGPRGGGIAHAVLDSNADPARGHRTWRLCRASLIAGRHKMTMKVTWLRGYDKREGFVKPSYFRLRRR